MTRLALSFAFGVFNAVLFLGVGKGLCAFGQTPTNAPAFSEVYDLVRTHLRGMSPAELDQVAAKGFITALAPRVSLASSPAAKPTNTVLLARALVIEDDVAYLRVSQVAEGLAKALADAQGELARTSKVVGLTLDLRYAGGEDYAAVLEAAALFVRTEAAMLDWGEGLKAVRPAAQTFSQPVAVLVNRHTVGAAEALAAVLREAGVGLILGQTTAGAAALMEEFPLKSGQHLRIATSPVRLANGVALSPQGVSPDITVAVDGDDERSYFADAYREPAKATEALLAREVNAANEASSTNRPNRRPRPNEADLVRARREGLPLDGDLVATRAPEPQRPVLRDPALARAVDLLKGLAVVRAKRP